MFALFINYIHRALDLFSQQIQVSFRTSFTNNIKLTETKTTLQTKLRESLHRLLSLSYDAGHAQLRSTHAIVVAEGPTLLTDDHRVQRARTLILMLLLMMIVVITAIVIAATATANAATVAVAVTAGGARRKRRGSGGRGRRRGRGHRVGGTVGVAGRAAVQDVGCGGGGAAGDRCRVDANVAVRDYWKRRFKNNQKVFNEHSIASLL